MTKKSKYPEINFFSIAPRITETVYTRDIIIDMKPISANHAHSHAEKKRKIYTFKENYVTTNHGKSWQPRINY